MSAVVFFQLMCSAFELATFIFALQSNKLLDSSTVPVILGIVAVSLPTILYCGLAEKMTMYLEAIGDTLYECSWYGLAVKQQKLLGLSIQCAQQTYRLTGFGIVECSLATFASVNVYTPNLHGQILATKVSWIFFRFSFVSQIIRATGSYFLLIYSLE